MRPVAAIDSGPESNGGAIAGQVAQAFADVDAERAQLLDRLVKGPYANVDPKRIPPEVLNQPQEEAMQKCDQGCGREVRARNGKVDPTCRKCRTKGKGESEAPAPEEKPVRKPTCKAADHRRGAAAPADMTVDELLELRAGVDEELRLRRTLAAAQLAELNRALGEKTETSGAVGPPRP